MTQQIIQAETQLTVAEKPATVGEFFQLMKPRVMSLVIFTGFAGMFLAPGSMHPLLAAIALFASGDCPICYSCGCWRVWCY